MGDGEQWPPESEPRVGGRGSRGPPGVEFAFRRDGKVLLGDEMGLGQAAPRPASRPPSQPPSQPLGQPPNQPASQLGEAWGRQDGAGHRHRVPLRPRVAAAGGPGPGRVGWWLGRGVWRVAGTGSRGVTCPETKFHSEENVVEVNRAKKPK